MAIKIAEGHQLITAGLSATVVYSIFALNVPNMADVRADEPGNTNTYKSVNTATWTAAGVTAGLALLAKSPTVFVVGGLLTLVETWKYHAANFGLNGDRNN